MTPEEMTQFHARLDIIRANLSMATTGGNFRAYTVLQVQDLDNIHIEPPAMAFVLEEGEFYFLHGPEFWFGIAGTHGAEREDNRWIKAPYSGMRALILASNVATIAAEATAALHVIVDDGPYNFNLDYDKYGSSYWLAIENILEIIRNTTFLELNTGTDVTTGELLYDVEDGDILLDDNLYCVQERNENAPNHLLGYPIKKIGTQPIRESIPGIQIQDQAERQSVVATHDTRIGYAVTSHAVSQGNYSIPVSVAPNSLPILKLNSDLKQWKDIRETTEVTRSGETWEYTSSNLVAPTKDDPGNWPFSGGTWAALPIEQPHIKVSDVTWNNPGADWPAGAEVTITLAESCPIPLIYGQTMVCLDSQPYLSAVAPVKSSFSFEPIGDYGGYLNATTIVGRLRPRTKKARLGEIPSLLANVRVDLYNPATENWGSGFPMSQGLKHHSPARGMRATDYVKMVEEDTMFRVNKVSANTLENPESMYLNKSMRPVEPPFTNIYGIRIGSEYWYWPNVENLRNLLYFTPFISNSTLPSGTYPVLVEGIEGNFLKLAAPLPADLPANTRIDLYPSIDTDVTSYAYYDPWEYMHKLETYNVAEFDLTKAGIWSYIMTLDALSQKLARCKAVAERFAYELWMTPPYCQLKPLAELFWKPEFNVLIEDESNLDKYSEALRVYNDRRSKLLALYNTYKPSAGQVEYLSILDYHRRGLQ